MVMAKNSAIKLTLGFACIALAGGLASAQEVQCPCFDANELKLDGRFVEEMAANEGVKTWRELDVIKRHTEDMYTAYFAIETFAPNDTETHANVYEYTYPTQGWLCRHSFIYLDRPVHPSIEVWGITEEESAACVAEITAAFTKLVKDDR
jgi:hypothetical protein